MGSQPVKQLKDVPGPASVIHQALLIVWLVLKKDCAISTLVLRLARWPCHTLSRLQDALYLASPQNFSAS